MAWDELFAVYVIVGASLALARIDAFLVRQLQRGYLRAQPRFELALDVLEIAVVSILAWPYVGVRLMMGDEGDLA